MKFPIERIRRYPADKFHQMRKVFLAHHRLIHKLEHTGNMFIAASITIGIHEAERFFSGALLIVGVVIYFIPEGGFDE